MNNHSIKTIDFYFFSGTGNTLLVVKKMKEVFENNRIVVNLFHLEKTDPRKIDTNHTIGLAVPVAEQGTFPLVWDFVKNMPQANETAVFMVDTMLAFSGGIVGPIRKILKPKGYKPIGAKEICMPNNLFPRKIDEEKNKEKVRKGLIRAEKYAEDIISGRSRWRRIPILSDFMGYFSKADWAWKSLRKHYKLAVDESKCIQCGLCESLCPVGNITMNDYPNYRIILSRSGQVISNMPRRLTHYYPEFQGKCTICMRCLSFCPKKAIARIKTKHEIYRAVNVKELID